MSASDVDLAEILEELQLDHEEACNDLVETQAEIRAAKLEAQELRLRLRAAGLSDKVSCTTPGLPASSSSRTPSGPADDLCSSTARAEPAVALRHMLKWIAFRIDLCPPLLFDANCDACVNERNVQLRRVAQWRLNAPGDLAVTVPAEMASEIAAMVLSIRSAGDVSPTSVEKLLLNWEIIARPSSESLPEGDVPVFCMSERKGAAAFVVAAWPHAPAVNVPPSSRPRHTRSSSCPTKCRGGPTVGDRVDVNYEGSWFAGKIHMILDDGNVYVQCDADPAGVLTLAHPAELRVPRTGRPSS